MGFMDKAKKMAEQAQAKLDEAQKQFNAGQGGAPAPGPAVEYDQHGRPVPPAVPPERSAGEPGWAPPSSLPGDDAWTPPHSEPPATGPTSPASSAPPLAAPAAPAAPPSSGPPAAPPSSAPAQAGSQGVPDDRNNPSHEPPPLTSGDPLAG